MRNSTIDFMRLVAAFFVIALHVGYYQDVSYHFGEVVRLSGRWAVPFFFLVSGYFIGIQEKENKCHLQAFRVVKILLISSIMYLPYCFMKDPNYLESISITSLIKSGTYFHLWFLSSLAIGLLSFQFLQKFPPRFLAMISSGLILAFVITDVAAYLEAETIFTEIHGTVRHTMSLAFIIIGYKISRLNIEKVSLGGLPILTTLIIFIAYFLEPFIVDFIVDSDVIKRQFPALTSLITIMIMLLCLKLSMKESIFSEAGRNLSLGIYLVHPLLIPIVNKVLAYFPSLPKTIPLLLITFLLSWMLVYMLMKKAPFLYELLYGNFKFSRS